MSLRRLPSLVAALCAALLLPALASAVPATIEVTPATWDMIGLDSNTPVSAGPDTFPAGVVACNTGDDTATNAIATLHWDSENALIDVESGVNTASIGDIPGGECREMYFNVVIDRGTDDSTGNPAFDTYRRYHITVAADGVAPVSTPTPRQVYVEKLVSQNRNTITAIRGGNCDASIDNYASCDPAPGTSQPGAAPVVVGGTYTYTLYASSATAYDQISAFISFPNTMFQIIDANTEYKVPPSDAPTSNTLWGNGCDWDSNPLSPDYASCIGTGERGGDVKVTYTVKIVGGGVSTVDTLINDFSGSSYHYNSDYGSGDGTFTINVDVPLQATVTGYGMVTSNTGGIACGTLMPVRPGATAGACAADYAANTVVTLTAEPDLGQAFVGWGGACQSALPQPPDPGPYTCAVTMDEAKYVTAAFEPDGGGAIEWPLAVYVDGLGTVTSDTGSLECTDIGGTCTDAYGNGIIVTLTAVVPPGRTFAGWGGACSGTALTCEVTMDQMRNVTATFLPTAYPITIIPQGAGTGSVTADPGPIANCTGASGTCTGNYAENSNVTLTSTPAPGSYLQGWFGDTTGCTPDPVGPPAPLTITCPADAARDIRPQYGLDFPLTVVVDGTGSGAVSADQGAISDCTKSGGVCTDRYPWWLAVELTATPQPGSTFTGWSGDVSACSLAPPSRPGDVTPADEPITNQSPIYCTMDAAHTVTATFTLNAPPVQYPLTVTVAGPGSVSSAPAGIANCAAGSGDCTESYDPNTYVTLTATPGPGSTFLGWSGVTCQPAIQSVSTTCNVLMSEAQNATASFSVPVVVEIVTPAGGGPGNSVTGPGIDCTNGVCTSSLPPGSRITLTAKPGPGQVFIGWGGACSGSQDTCTITVEQLAQVKASFGVAPSATLRLTPVPKVIRSGRSTAVRVAWTNPTATPLGATTITMRIPTGMAFQSSSCNVEVTGKVITIDAGTVGANATAQCAVRLKGVSRTRVTKRIAATLTAPQYAVTAKAATAVTILPAARRAPVTG